MLDSSETPVLAVIRGGPDIKLIRVNPEGDEVVGER